jgi:hypothetical protein
MPLIRWVAGTPTAHSALPEVTMGDTYRLEGEEESCEDAHKMRDELELQLSLSFQQSERRRWDPPGRQAARLNFARKPAIQRSRRT